MENGALPVMTSKRVSFPVGPRTGITSDQIIEANDENIPKVVKPKLFLDRNTKMVIDLASHELAQKVPALVFQILEQEAQKYINQRVQNSLQENRWEATQSPQTVPVVAPFNQLFQIFSRKRRLLSHSFV